MIMFTPSRLTRKLFFVLGKNFQHFVKFQCNSNIALFCSAIKDPQILELSGIGRPDILSKIGVDVKLELPGVGENVQDHIIIPMTFELDPKASHETLDAMANPDHVQKVMKL